MGYYSKLQGSLAFNPPISGEAVTSLSALDNLSYGGRFDEYGWRDDGDEGKMYHLARELSEVIRVVTSEGSSVTGIIEVFGEDNTDIHRFVVDEGQIVHERAWIVWPDGTSVVSNY